MLLVQVDSVVAVGGLCGDGLQARELGLKHGLFIR